MRLKLIAVASALLAACLVYLVSAPEDHIKLEYRADDLFYYGDADTLAETPPLDLPPGEFSFYISTRAEAGAARAGDESWRFELFSPYYTGSGNAEGRVFASVPIKAGSGAAELRCETDSVIRGARLRVRSYGASGDVTVYLISCDNKAYNDAEVLAVLAAAFVLAAAVYLFRRGHKLKNGEYGEAAAIAVCLLTAVIATAPIARLSLSYAHDIYFHLTRIEGIYEGLLSGQFPVRINPTFIHGYGYADPIMYPPLFLYFPAALRLLGASLTTSYQIFMFGVNLLTAGVSYACFKRIFGRRDLGIFASAAYTLCLYRLICILTRAAVGEVLAMAFLPLAALGMYETFFGDAKRGAGRLILGFTGLLGSHVISVEIALMTCAVFAAVNIRRLSEKRRLAALLIAAADTLLLNAGTLVPMLLTGRTGLYALNASRDISGHAVYPAEMFATFVKASGLSGDIYEPYTDMPLSVGGIFGLGALAFIVIRLIYRRNGLLHGQGSNIGRVGSAGLGVALPALFLASTMFPWKAVADVPGLSAALALVQFPWRYFGVASLGLTLVLTAAVAFICNGATASGPERGRTCDLHLRAYGPGALPRRPRSERTFDLTCVRARGTRQGAKRPSRRLVAGAALLAVIFAVSPYLDNYAQDSSRPAALPRKYSELATYAVGGQEYLRQGTSLDALRSRGPAVSAAGAEITDTEREFTSVSFSYDSAEIGAYAELPLYYYDGYRAETSGGAALGVTEGENGVVRVALPEGSGGARVYYAAPGIYRIAELVSAAAFVCSVIFICIMRRRAADAARCQLL
ncbi:MAG: hypothetical protein LBK23_06280 [Oscillospiraceae bacterium]|nr:hypothetical protein [Oscillospiraceae bacterium]